MGGFQAIWEELRKKGKNTTRFPYDKIISFVFRYYPKEKPKTEVKILEVGCGAGNNLWALALEGFDVYGIDGSETAIKVAKDTFKRFGLKGNFYIQDFTENFPFENETFDLVIDRGSITCVDFDGAKRTINEIYRVLKKGGYFFFNPYSTEHFTYKSSNIRKSDRYVLTEKGAIAGTGYVCFYSLSDIKELCGADKWEILGLKHVTVEDKVNPERFHAEWEIVARKR